MPDEYELSVGKLVNYISDDQIGSILSSSNASVANKLILDCLIERISSKEELLDLCDQLESVIISHDLKIVVNEIRLGQYIYVYVASNYSFPYCITFCTIFIM